ncbi:MAG TPA: PHP domain-containing protein [Candidatus Saccharimonadales bacterium]|nr:PHP domain-containing protein [Candidatus Saccharimonadales bacterium]
MTTPKPPRPAPRPTRHDPAPVHGAVVPPAPSSVDLHAHTTRSDGIVPPAALVRQAFEAGVRTFALTDHDTLAGYREVMAADAVPAGLRLLPGVEINALVTRDLGLWEGELHILGFGMDPNDEAFEAQLAAQRGRRRERFTRTVTKLRNAGMPIDDQVVGLVSTDDDAMGRPTIARALIAAGHATSVEDAFRRLIGHGGPGYVPREGLGPTEAIQAVTAAGGVPVLAHFSEAPTRRELLQELIEEGLVGLEVYYRSFDIDTVAAVGAVARDLGLLPTGGTDYHGDLGPYAEAHRLLWVPPEIGESLLERIARA